MKQIYEKISIKEIAVRDEHSFLASSEDPDPSILTMAEEDFEIEPFTCHEFPPVSF